MILLDTHVLVWWLNGGFELSAAARAAIDGEISREEGQVMVSSITAWELAMLVQRQRLILRMDLESWLATAARIPQLRFIPVDNTIAINAAVLPEPFHKDPADRIIVATARALAAPLVTADERIRAYPQVRSIW